MGGRTGREAVNRRREKTNGDRRRRIGEQAEGRVRSEEEQGRVKRKEKIEVRKLKWERKKEVKG